MALEDIDRHIGRRYVLLQKLYPRKVFKPRMLFYLDYPIFSTQALRRFSLNHLNQGGVTLLMKSAASSDQLGGIYSALICTCLLNIWSLISLRFLPL